MTDKNNILLKQLYTMYNINKTKASYQFDRK